LPAGSGGIPAASFLVVPVETESTELTKYPAEEF
jgi:hypothetical protein